MTTQLYAKIRMSSKYHYQAKWAEEAGEYPFPVTIQSDACGYVVAGGPGGQYKLTDVHLHARVGDKVQKLT